MNIVTTRVTVEGFKDNLQPNNIYRLLTTDCQIAITMEIKIGANTHNHEIPTIPINFKMASTTVTNTGKLRPNTVVFDKFCIYIPIY